MPGFFPLSCKRCTPTPSPALPTNPLHQDSSVSEIAGLGFDLGVGWGTPDSWAKKVFMGLVMGMRRGFVVLMMRLIVGCLWG